MKKKAREEELPTAVMYSKMNEINLMVQRRQTIKTQETLHALLFTLVHSQGHL